MAIGATKKTISRCALAIAGGMITCLPSACHQPAPAPTLTAPSAQPSTTTQTPSQGEHTRQAPAPTSAPAECETARWLYVERFTPGTTGGFVEGDFNAKRNRLTIKTDSVTRFTIDTRYIAINWDKLVVIQLDGLNSELKRRDDPVLHFVLDKYNRWVVDE
jgi:hypothetical protein